MNSENEYICVGILIYHTTRCNIREVINSRSHRCEHSTFPFKITQNISELTALKIHRHIAVARLKSHYAAVYIEVSVQCNVVFGLGDGSIMHETCSIQYNV